MKPLLLLAAAMLAGALTLLASDGPPGVPAPANPAASRPGGNAVIPTADFPASRYEALWKKSPFSVATPDGPADTTPDYALYGIANVDGITYASIVDAHTNEHFLISSDKPTRGLTLNTITREPNGGDTYANVMKDGQLLTLKLASAPAAAQGAEVGGNPPAVGGPSAAIVPNIQAPGSGPIFGNGSVRPFPHIRRPHITLPPVPAQAQPPPPPPMPAH